MSEVLARAMEKRQTRWESRGLWSQWFDAAKAAGFNDREAARYANARDEDLRDEERKHREAERRIAALVRLGASTPPPVATAIDVARKVAEL